MYRSTTGLLCRSRAHLLGERFSYLPWRWRTVANKHILLVVRKIRIRAILLRGIPIRRHGIPRRARPSIRQQHATAESRFRSQHQPILLQRSLLCPTSGHDTWEHGLHRYVLIDHPAKSATLVLTLMLLPWFEPITSWLPIIQTHINLLKPIKKCVRLPASINI